MKLLAEMVLWKSLFKLFLNNWNTKAHGYHHVREIRKDLKKGLLQTNHSKAKLEFKYQGF